MCVCVCVWVCVCVYIHIYTYIHAYIHTAISDNDKGYGDYISYGMRVMVGQACAGLSNVREISRVRCEPGFQ